MGFWQMTSKIKIKWRCSVEALLFHFCYYSVENFWVFKRELGKHLAVKRDILCAKSRDEAAVGKAVSPDRGVDADVPERAEV